MSPTIALLAFAAAAAVLIVTPGLDTALVLRTTAVEGPRRAAAAALGICCGLLIWGLAVALGVAALLAASHLAYTVPRWTGAVYLIWLGGHLLLRSRHATPEGGRGVTPRVTDQSRRRFGPRRRPRGALFDSATFEAARPAAIREPADNRGAALWFARGLLSNLTNPKVGVFYVTFLPQFVPAGVAVGPFVALLVAIHVAMSIPWLGVLIVATRSVAGLLHRPAVTRTLDRATGAALVGAGLRLAAEGRR